MPRVDLNCDLSEGAGHDAELMPLITSVNIACGAHAGDEATMRATVALARRHGVAIGAHPGFADRENFGRVERRLVPHEAGALVIDQIQVLSEMVGEGLHHVKLHGALYNMAARDQALAMEVALAIQTMGDLLVYAPWGSELAKAAGVIALPVAHEVFADRTYQADGSLTPRERPDALITDEKIAVEQVLRLVREGKVRATDGNDVSVRADTVCLHGDGSHAVAFAHRVSAALKAAGVELRSVRD